MLNVHKISIFLIKNLSMPTHLPLVHIIIMTWKYFANLVLLNISRND